MWARSEQATLKFLALKTAPAYTDFMRFASLIVLTLASASLVACVAPVRTPAGSSNTLIPPAETGPYVVIGHLEHRDHLVTIKTGEQGTVYSVTNKKDGKPLYENLTAEQLKSQSPEMLDFIKGAEAGQASNRYDLIGIK